MKNTGKVKHYNDSKGYGFISIEGQEDLFFHKSNWKENYEPTKGDMVQFTVGQSKKGKNAENVQYLLQ